MKQQSRAAKRRSSPRRRPPESRSSSETDSSSDASLGEIEDDGVGGIPRRWLCDGCVWSPGDAVWPTDAPARRLSIASVSVNYSIAKYGAAYFGRAPMRDLDGDCVMGGYDDDLGPAENVDSRDFYGSSQTLIEAARMPPPPPADVPERGGNKRKNKTDESSAPKRTKYDVSFHVKVLSAQQQVLIMYARRPNFLLRSRHSRYRLLRLHSHLYTEEKRLLSERDPGFNPAKYDHCFAPWSKRYAVVLDTSIPANTLAELGRVYSHLSLECVDKALRHMAATEEGDAVEVLVTPYRYLLMQRDSQHGEEICATTKPMDAGDIFAVGLKTALLMGGAEQNLSSEYQMLVAVLWSVQGEEVQDIFKLLAKEHEAIYRLLHDT
ncbi:hypothetical protein V1517DRAFT_338906 [Lipomyces orientalis]|uniref:Uncharacterized protein n=1 Tax=Lipomyces orientalis TaxID=1233043 RepID=A0ACC3TMU7_9ASCO